MTDAESGANASQWAEFLRWAQLFVSDAGFDARERTYKLAAAAAIRDGLDAWREGRDDWPDVLKTGIQSKHNNLTGWRVNEPFLRWLAQHADRASSALAVLFDTERNLADRVDGFVASVDDPEALKALGNQLGIASLLLLADEPESYPFYKATPVKNTWKLLQLDSPARDESPGRIYQHLVDFCDELLRRAGEAGVALRDRLDAQSVIWCVSYGAPLDEWSTEQKEALAAFRLSAGGTAPRGSSATAASAPAVELPTAEVARADRYALMRRAWEAGRVSAEPSTTPVTPSDRWAARLAVVAAADADGVLEDLLAESGAAIQSVSSFLATLARKARGDAEATDRLADLLALPASDRAAHDAATELASLVDRLGASGAFNTSAAARALASVWSLADPVRFPAFTQSCLDVMRTLRWVDRKATTDVTSVWSLLRQLDPDQPARAAVVLDWAATNFSGLDATLVARCRANRQRCEVFAANGNSYGDDVMERAARTNTECLGADLRLAGQALRAVIGEIIGTDVSVVTPSLTYGSGTGYSFRHEVFVAWKPKTTPAAEIRLWVTSDGVYMGLWVLRTNEAALQPALEAIAAQLPEGISRFARRASATRMWLEPADSGPMKGGELLGRWFDATEALDQPDFGDRVLAVVAELRPIIRRIANLAEGDRPLPTDDEEDLTEDETAVDHLAAAADDLLIDLEYLEEIVELLDDRKQVVFYGPPGTGKTYVAQRLAEALAEGEPSRWQLVQFHPSTSYEDFFEGFRPEVVDGAMSYELQPGPLARMADLAAADRHHTYVLVIDEINRANIPKVFGELLYLLEYRDRPVRALYRPDTEFFLPPNLRFIGTMNTADRSIGLVDAAMRRRFGFVGFFPDQEPMAGLLPEWLRKNGEPEWVAQLVDQVNERLRESLSRHLQIGPSFFLKKGLDQDKVAKIWKHSIEPFIEDQFFGDEDRIAEFSWDSVWKSFNQPRRGAAQSVEADVEAEVEADDQTASRGEPG